MIYPDTSDPLTGAGPRAMVELRLIGAMLLDDPLNADLYERIEAEDFHEPLLRLAWQFAVELKRTVGEVNVSLVCGQFERDGVYDAFGVRTLLDYAASPGFTGVGAEARPDWIMLASDRGNVLSIGGVNFLAIGA